MIKALPIPCCWHAGNPDTGAKPYPCGPPSRTLVGQIATQARRHMPDHLAITLGHQGKVQLAVIAQGGPDGTFVAAAVWGAGKGGLGERGNGGDVYGQFRADCGQCSSP